MLSNTGTTKPIPRIDERKRIPFAPASIRFVFHTGFIWAVASMNNEEFSTLHARTFADARYQALVEGKMFAVTRWQMTNYF